MVLLSSRGFTPAPESYGFPPMDERGKTTKRINKIYGRKSMVWGFTLIEMLIVVAVTGLLSGFFVAYSSAGRQQVTLAVEQAKIAQIITRSKALALSGYASGASSTCGYGFRVDYPGAAYALFSYREPDCSAITSVDAIDPSKYTEVVRFPLQRGLEFTAGGTAPLDAVLFVPPDPLTLIWTVGGGTVTSTQGTVYVVASGGAAGGRVSVGIGGQVSTGRQP